MGVGKRDGRRFGSNFWSDVFKKEISHILICFLNMHQISAALHHFGRSWHILTHCGTLSIVVSLHHKYQLC